MSREEENKKEWIDLMVKELDTEEKLRDDLSDYYNLMQTNQKLIYLLSDGLLSKPNYAMKVFEEFLEKYCEKKFLSILSMMEKKFYVEYENEEPAVEAVSVAATVTVVPLTLVT